MNNITEFQTSTGEVVTGDELQAALNAIADYFERDYQLEYNENSIRGGWTKKSLLEFRLKNVAKVRKGEHTPILSYKLLDRYLTGQGLPK